ncbi:MAG: response regulator transcription factor [Rhodocyclaceae bacterium]|nr:response regulator transcription factor [Rhodocyclaceae bacterium]
MNGNIRILLVDDHTLFRSGIKSLLERQPGMEVVDEACDGLEGIKRARILKPDVVLLDLHMTGLSGRDAVQLICEEVPETNVLMLTVSEDSEDLLATLRAGAIGYLLKNIEVDALVNAVRSAARGEAVVSPQMTAKLVAGVRSERKSEDIQAEKEKLSPREREILGFLARGESNKQIARNLNLAESTVKIHVQNILKKLNLTSRVQAAVYAVEQGLGKSEG